MLKGKDNFSKKKKTLLNEFINSQIYFLKLIYKEHPKSFILFGSIVLLASFIPPVVVLVYKETINEISKMSGNTDNFRLVIFFLSLYAILTLLSEVLREANDYIFKKISYTVNYVLKTILSNKLIKIPLKEFEDSRFYDSINLANHAVGGSGIRVVKSLIDIMGSIISLFALFGILLTIHWSLPLALFLSTMPGITLIFIGKFKTYKMHRDISAIERELHFTDGLFIDKKSLREIKIYELGFFLLDKWKKLYKKTEVRKLEIAFWELKSNSFGISILQFSNLAISIFLVIQIFGDKLTIGDYIALISAVTTVQGLFAIIGASLGNIFETAIYNNALLSILNYKEKNDGEVPNSISIKKINTISIENGTFCYPNSQIEVMNNININIKKGEKISIVGSNGSGKTTLVYCLLGLYDLNSGLLKINDIEIGNINKKTFFKRVSAIFQDFIRYKYTVRENISFGDLLKINDDNLIHKILTELEMDEKINKLNGGLDTYLSKEVPNGTELSGGEWQRIALARAYLKDADLVILDEPTAALDPVSELKVFDLFHKLSKDKTTLTISHRIGPTKLSDYIIVMEKGKIVETGTYTELLSKKGVFYRMYKSQSIWYQEANSPEGQLELINI